MKAFLILLIGILSITDECDIPGSIEDVINLKFPESEIVSKSLLTNDWQLFLETECPTVVEGDFNGDEILDYAVITTSNGPDPYHLLIAQSENNKYELIKVLDIGFGIYNEGLGFGIELISQGQIQGITAKPSFEYDGIILKKFESSSQVIYFDGKTYQKEWIGD